MANLGGTYLNIQAVGADETLDKLNQIAKLSKEIKQLLQELSEMSVLVDIKPLSKSRPR